MRRWGGALRAIIAVALIAYAEGFLSRLAQEETFVLIVPIAFVLLGLVCSRLVS